MEFIVGICLALLVCGAASSLGMHRDRVFYPCVLITVASYYLSFAVADGRGEVMFSEVAISAVFIGISIIGYKCSLWFVAVALAGHGVMDVSTTSSCTTRMYQPRGQGFADV